MRISPLSFFFFPSIPSLSLPSFFFSSSSIPPFLRHLPRLRPLRRSSCRWSNAAPATAKATPAMCSAPNGLGKMIKLRPKVKILRSVTTMPAVVAPNSGRRKPRVVRACLWGGWVNFRIVRCVLTFEVEMYRDLFVSLSLFLSIFISLYLSIFPLFFSSLSLLSLSLLSLSLLSLFSYLAQVGARREGRKNSTPRNRSGRGGGVDLGPHRSGGRVPSLHSRSRAQ